MSTSISQESHSSNEVKTDRQTNKIITDWLGDRSGKTDSTLYYLLIGTPCEAFFARVPINNVPTASTALRKFLLSEYNSV